MYTASDIRNVEFTKNMGGYKVNEVEAFVDTCADTVDALNAEKEELNKKLAILADKLVEYRRDEDSIRSALLSAQRMGDSIVREANEKAAQIVEAARVEAAKIVDDAKNGIDQYQGELERLKQEVADFKASVLSLYKDHLAMLKSIPDVEEEAVEEAEEEVVEQTVIEPIEEDADDDMIVVEEPAAVQPAQPAKSKFANLKFGEDYDIDQDED